MKLIYLFIRQKSKSNVMIPGLPLLKIFVVLEKI